MTRNGYMNWALLSALFLASVHCGVMKMPRVRCSSSPNSFTRPSWSATTRDPARAFGQDQLPDIVLGPPDGRGPEAGGLDVLSLGQGGSIVLGFGDSVIIDGPGPDFIVFENPFWVGGDSTNVFAELGQVEVSEDGQTWVGFSCNVDTREGCAGWHPPWPSSRSRWFLQNLRSVGAMALTWPTSTYQWHASFESPTSAKMTRAPARASTSMPSRLFIAQR